MIRAARRGGGLACALCFALVASRSAVASADEPAPMSTVAVLESTDPRCSAASLRCEATSTSAVDVRAWAKAVEPAAQDLRRCLDGLGQPDVAATVRIAWDGAGAARAEVPVLTACTAAAKARLEMLASAESLALSCVYSCGRAPAPPTTPALVAPPSPPLVVPALAPLAPKDAPAPQPKDRWYGWQTLLVDAAALGTIAVGVAEWKLAPILVGYSAFVVGPPVVHGLHRNTHRGIGSFFLRLVGPVTAGLLVYRFIPTPPDQFGKKPSTDQLLRDGLTALAIGTGVAFATCVAVDAAVFGWERPTTKEARHRPTIAPALEIGSTSFIGARGTF